jgi:hypothetical protein
MSQDGIVQLWTALHAHGQHTPAAGGHDQAPAFPRSACAACLTLGKRTAHDGCMDLSRITVDH